MREARQGSTPFHSRRLAVLKADLFGAIDVLARGVRNNSDRRGGALLVAEALLFKKKDEFDSSCTDTR